MGEHEDTLIVELAVLIHHVAVVLPGTPDDLDGDMSRHPRGPGN
jgi:hypothetical protein